MGIADSALLGTLSLEKVYDHVTQTSRKFINSHFLMRKTQKRGLKLLYPLLNGDLLKGHTHMVQYLCAHAAPLLSDEFELDVIESALMRGKVQVLRVLFKDKRYDLAIFLLLLFIFGALCESAYHYGGSESEK